jgi:hypothetical protein
MPAILKIFLLVSLLAIPASASADQLSSFTSDGCSSFPDGTLDQQSLWLDCCIRHDLSYWKGGTYEERLAADQALERCVNQVGQPDIARLMLAGVRVGGSPYYPTPFRWGYGWPYARGYKALGPDEKQQVKYKLQQLETLLKNISREIQDIE